MKIDIHTNLDDFVTSKSSDKRIYASIDETAEFLLNNQIDVNFSLYPRDGYDLLKELASKTPGIKHIGVQVLMGKDASDPTNIDKVKLDRLDPTKELCFGFKIASHRGWWVRDYQGIDLEGNIIGNVNSGFDYGKDSRTMHKWLKQLPENSIVSMHLQGDPINNSASIPMTVGMYAYKYPHLKFIANHCGDYGQGGLSNKPKNYMSGEEDSIFAAFRHAHHKALISSAVHFANDQHNVLLDTSVYTPFKGKMMGECKRWAIGSDYPFQKTKDLFLKQEKSFIKDLGEEAVKQCHLNAYHWLTADWKTLRDEHANEYSNK